MAGANGLTNLHLLLMPHNNLDKSAMFSTQYAPNECGNQLSNKKGYYRNDATMHFEIVSAVIEHAEKCRYPITSRRTVFKMPDYAHVHREI